MANKIDPSIRCRNPNPIPNPHLKEVANRPETRAKLEAYWQRRRENPQNYYRRGVPSGMRKEEADREWAFARMYAKEVVKIMVAKDIIEDDPKVIAAFESAMEVLQSPMNQTTKLQAARLILDFCKSKPVAKSEVTVQKAEDWLAAVTSDALKNG